MVLLSKSGRMTVKVLHSQGSSGGNRLRRKALGPPRIICIKKKDNVNISKVKEICGSNQVGRYISKSAINTDRRADHVHSCYVHKYA